jgi:glutamine synthetase
MATDGEIILLAWSDYVGFMRCRGVPVDQIDDRMAHGLGWAVAGQAQTPFADLAPNPWGPMTEVRQVPVPNTRTRVDIWQDAPALHFYLCDSMGSDGTNWDCCTRGFYKAALADLKAETGLDFVAAYEHEFMLMDDPVPAAPSFTIETMRNVAGFTRDVTRGLLQAQVELETVEPEFGEHQYEITCAPAVGVQAAERAIITREVIRECARRLGYRATFTPKVAPDGIGNGAHVHFSLNDGRGRNVTHDPDGLHGASRLAQQFIAGVTRHMPAMCALTSPSPVSYLRLGPHHWSCGYASFGVQNREASIRICPSPERDPAKASKAFNLELRPPDATASPYLVLGALVRAGLQGIREELPLPEPVGVDPADLSPEERQRMGIRPLPGSLAEALDLMDADPIVRSWLPPLMYESYVSVKRTEVELAKGLTPEQLCEKYARVY